MRLIDADALMEKYHKTTVWDSWVEINNAPTVDAEPVKHGKWVDKCVRDWRCSECNCEIQKIRHVDGYCYNDLPNYCPNCGAKMDEEE